MAGVRTISAGLASGTRVFESNLTASFMLRLVHELREQMSSIHALVSTPDRSFNALMERVAAAILHRATCEEVAEETAEGDGTSGEVATETAVDEAAVDEASGGNVDGDVVSFSVDVVCEEMICTVCIGPSNVEFIIPEGQPHAENMPAAVPVELVQDISALCTKASMASCGMLLPTNTGSQHLELTFKAKSAFAAMQKEHTKRRDQLVQLLKSRLAASRETRPQEATEEETQIRPPAAPASQGQSKQAVESARMRKG
ncbi:MAG: hypothetical protein SGPRY_012702 [Prymnesium sp.]